MLSPACFSGWVEWEGVSMVGELPDDTLSGCDRLRLYLDHLDIAKRRCFFGNSKCQGTSFFAGNSEHAMAHQSRQAAQSIGSSALVVQYHFIQGGVMKKGGVSGWRCDGFSVEHARYNNFCIISLVGECHPLDKTPHTPHYYHCGRGSVR